MRSTKSPQSDASFRDPDSSPSTFRKVEVPTRMGRVAVWLPDGQPGQGQADAMLMHGIFLDHSIWWPSVTPAVRSVLIDMPSHGDSESVPGDWSLADCVEMLADIVRTLELQRPILIGHSWGGMVALRYAMARPDDVAALGLVNTPWQRVRGVARWGFHLQKQLLRFPRFYAAQAAKSLFGDEFLSTSRDVVTSMQNTLASRPPVDWRRVLDAVLLNPDDMASEIQRLSIPMHALVGESDYVGCPQGIETVIACGGHVSPLESPAEVTRFIESIASAAS